MNQTGQHDDEDLHAFIDGEMAPERLASFAALLESDPALAARVAAFQADKVKLARIFSPIAQRALPDAWGRQIEKAFVPAASRSAQPARRSIPWRAAIAASLLLVCLGGGVELLRPPADTILADAQAAHDGVLAADTELTGQALPAEAARNTLLHATLGLSVHAPDLTRFGYQLVSLEIFGRHSARPAAGLVYRNAQAVRLTIFVRHSAGEARFDLLRRGKLRVCIWQDDVVGAVMTGEMEAGEMMRVASRAYTDLDL